ncbi:MAG: zeta toxin family protein [Neisseriaceae bacterium]|nr:zeta toxin family protein [Neisseriaceae bacterium]
MPKPVAVFFAGCNGSGKSTLRDEILKSNQPFIDADLIAKQVSFSHIQSADIAAGREAIRRFRLFIEQKQSFSIETTLSGIGALNNMRKAQNAGFEVHLYYCALANVELNIARVAERVAKGGHHIPENTIRRRYDESLQNLKTAIEIADEYMIFDNSNPQEKYKICVIHENSENYVAHLPNWLEQYLPNQIMQQYWKQQYIQAKATLSPKEQESLTVAERLIHHAFEKENISARTQEYYLGNFYRNTTAEIQNGTFTIPNPYQKTPTISKKTDKGIDI